MGPTVDTSDFRVLIEFYQELSDMDKRKIWLTAYRKAAQPLLRKAKANAPWGTTTKKHVRGALARSLVMEAVPGEIAIDVGASLKKPSGWMAHFIDTGTKERFRKTKKGKVSTGRIIGTHFFEKAVEEESDKITEAADIAYYEAIDKAIVKYNNKSKK